MQPKTIKSKNNNIFENGRRPQLFWKCKTTSKKITQPKTIQSRNNNIFENGRRTQLFKKEDDLNFFEKWRRP